MTLRPRDFERIGDDFFILAQDSIFRCQLFSTGVSDNEEGDPEEFALLQNYPNPFNPSTKITFRLDAPANIVLAIYDINGREVRRLMDGNRGAGEHSVVWDGNDASGAILTSGTYFYRLQAGTKMATGKMALVK